MVTGHLRQKRGIYHIILYFKDEDGITRTQSRTTGLRTRGNAKKAELLMREAVNKKEEEIAAKIKEKEEGNDPANIPFTKFLLEWLDAVKYNVETTTYASYVSSVKKSIIPYFDELYPGLKLKDLNARKIQLYYNYELTTKHLSANTVVHRHAHIRKALDYAYRQELIDVNPADRVQKPRIEPYEADTYNENELSVLFRAAHGTAMEFAIISGAFYGLRRSEICGLKWDAIDFQRKTFTVKHIVTEAYVDGKITLVRKDRAKTRASQRSLPLIEAFEKLLLKMKKEQEENRKLCGDSYNQEFLDYIYVDALGNLVKPGYISQEFPRLLKKNNLRKIRFHDLRHSCATLLYSHGVSLKEIQEWLGHSTISTTSNIYTHLDFNSKINSLNAIKSVYPAESPDPQISPPQLKQNNQ